MTAEPDYKDRFTELMQAYASPIRRLCTAYADNPADREDLSQDIFLAVWRALPGFRGDASVRTWLYRIAHNWHIDTVLDRDRAAREGERRIRIGALGALMLLLPMMLWSAAHGVTPLVRGAYALMAAGSAVIVFAEWIYLEWSRQALPGPADARSQLQKSAFMLARQVMLMQTAPIWSSPIFIGVALIGLWLYRERSHAEAFVVWAITVAGWLAIGLGTITVRARLNERRQQMERLLGELQ